MAARDAAREDRREGIIDVARACFLAEGYGATSMSTIAARLGGSKGTLYNYFRSKEELFEAVVRCSCVQLRMRLEAHPEAGDVRKRLEGVAEAFLRHLISPEALGIQRLVIGEGERFPELARLFYEAGPRIGLAHMAEMISGLMDQGVLRKADPTVAASQFRDLALSGVHYLRLWRVIEDPSPEEIAARVGAAVDTFLRAYGPEQP